MGFSKRARISLISVAIMACCTIVIGWRTIEYRRQARIMRMDPEMILTDDNLAPRTLALGKSVYRENCASCHSEGSGNPAKGVPDLTDQDFLYGTGKVAEIEQIVLHGIRSGDPRGWHLASMPVYASARPYSAEPIPPLTPQGVRDVTQFILQKHGTQTDDAAAKRGAHLFAHNGGCWDCHEADAGGDSSIGAPNLVDDVWLYGDGSAASIERSIMGGRAGISPAYATKLSAIQARAVAVYVAALAKHDSRTALP